MTSFPLHPPTRFSERFSERFPEPGADDALDELEGAAEARDVTARASAVVAVACDRAALSALYGELAPRVQRFLRDLLGDGTLAADATQETFIRAFRRVGDVAPGARLGAWVFGIARNVSLELRKARGRARRMMSDDELAPDAVDPTRSSRSPETELLDREALVVVGRALDRLTDDRRAVLLLRLDHGMAYDEIAETMGWSLAKVKVEIFRAREVLRATLEEYRGGCA